ncbi:MAG: cell division protein FtsQ [Lachnospiraceae bacterium]|nr:cell division protein FtsQ [Lachnospiraceae bacterium]
MSKRKKRKLNMTGGKKGLMVKCGLVALVMLLIAGGVIWFLNAFRITSVMVEGNIHYSTDQITEMVMNSDFSNNSVFLSMQYHNKSITDVPFVERIDVSVVDRQTVKITVYEKTLAGYVQYLGSYMYFDKDGIVVESSNVLTPGIPEVSGLKFNHVVLHEALPVENEEIFQEILNITNLLNKHGLSATKIQFDSLYDVSLHFGKVRVIMGEDADMDQIIMHLTGILPHLEGKSGVLHMENFSESNKDITFEEDI